MSAKIYQQCFLTPLLNYHKNKNCSWFLLILLCYIEIVRAVKNSAKQLGRNPDRDKQVKLTKKVKPIVFTEFACWFRLVILGILIQAKVIILPPSVYAWSVIFVLPLNSAMNPYLYTIAEIISNKHKNKQPDTKLICTISTIWAYKI